jgi:hypothetical protein
MDLLFVFTVTILGVLLLKTSPAEAHCDTLSGPVIGAARKAFEERNVTQVLKWIRPEDEDEVKKVFERACRVRDLGPEARELAENSFFETLVRIHRAGEGAPYEGLKPEHSVAPVVRKADLALETGDVSELANRISSHVKTAVEEKFQHAFEKKRSAEETPEKGREFVEAYISFVHYVEGIHELTMGNHSHGEHHH